MSPPSQASVPLPMFLSRRNRNGMSETKLGYLNNEVLIEAQIFFRDGQEKRIPTKGDEKTFNANKSTIFVKQKDPWVLILVLSYPRLTREL